MSSDPKKKKIESLLLSISNLENKKVLYKGDKRYSDSIDKMIERFKSDIKKLKSS